MSRRLLDETPGRREELQTTPPALHSVFRVGVLFSGNAAALRFPRLARGTISLGEDLLPHPIQYLVYIIK